MLYENELNAVLQETMQRWDIPGLAVGLVEGSEIVYAKGFGVQSLATRAPVTLDSVFCVQSVSKCFVATAVMQMAERGELDLDAPLVQYLPYFRLDDARCRQITLRQALSHTSGMPDLDEIEYVTLVSQPEVDEGAAERFVRGLSGRKLVASPGERFSYSNIAYNVLGDLLAKVSGQSFERLMRERILIPAGIPHSTFLLADVPPNRLAMPHLRSPEMRVNAPYPYHRADAPSSFLHTTVVELCRWAITSLQQGSDAGRRLLSPAGYAQMWTAVAERGSQRPSIYEHMGLGWTLGHYKDVKTVSHGGAGFGGSAFLLLLPEVKRAAVVLCSEESNAHYRIVQALADALLGEKPQTSSVSWMVPVSHALAAGGIAEAAARLPEIQARQDEYYFHEYDLIDLSLQLFTAREIDLAIEVLGLNLHVYPQHVDSYLQQAKYDLHKGKVTQARERLEKALAIEPGNVEAARLVEEEESG